MARKNRKPGPTAHLYQRETYYTTPEGRVIEENEIIKIKGEYGTKFKFKAFVTKLDNGAQWIDCMELERGVVSKWRSFKADRIKPLPKTRRPRKKKV